MNKETRAILKSLKHLDMVMVEWIDAEQESSGWQDITAPIGTRVVVARTVGFYSIHNKSLLRTYSNYDPSNGMGTGRDDIPLSAIKGIFKLEVKNAVD
jgi:hypothetical protein